MADREDAGRPLGERLVREVRARVADRDGPLAVARRGPEHVAELLAVPGLHHDDARDHAEERDVEGAVLGRSVLADEARPVDA